MSAAYDALIAHSKETAALAAAGGVLSWDQQAKMPPKGAAQRAEQLAAVEAALHRRRTDPAVAGWLAEITPETLAPAAARNVALIAREHRRATRLPETLQAEIARQTALATVVWEQARAAGDVAMLAPALTEVVRLKREEAACLTEPGMSAYEGLLDLWEPGARMSRIGPMFARLAEGLAELRAALRPGALPPLSGDFPTDQQHALALEIAADLGYDLAAGRLDAVTHPFCSGTQGDVRVTTRFFEDDPLPALYATIHEVGHALYEQNRDPARLFEPVAGWASMALHESQSRLLENQIGRSPAFAAYLAPKLREAFPGATLPPEDALYHRIAAVSPGFIRVEADELHYNLHIVLRTELEEALINGTLEVSDLEAAWNARFRTLFGRAVPSPKDGMLQDVHWPAGLFGYFPTYTLGNVYAAALFARMHAEMPGLDADIAAGRFGAATAWLTERIHRRGAEAPAETILEETLGSLPDERPLLDYLSGKYTP